MNLQSVFFLLADQLLKGAAILVFAAVASLVFPRASAAKRGALWLSAFLVIALLPATQVITPKWVWHPNGRVAVTTTLPAISARSRMIVPSMETAAPALTPSLLERMDWAATLVAFWSIGAGFLLLRRAMADRGLRRVLRQSRPAGMGLLSATLHDELIYRPLRCPIRLRISPTCLVPVTWGIWRPVILLPAEAEGWSAERCRIVLGHELAHIRRGDFAARMLAHFVGIFHWCNPLAWLAARQLRLAQEQACDDLVLGGGTDAADYATELVECVRRVHFVPVAFRQTLAMAQPSTLEIRVRAVMDEKRDRSSAGRWQILTSALLVPLFLIVSGLVQVAATDPPAGLGFNPIFAVEKKAEGLIVPHLELREATLNEAVEVLAREARDADPEKQGLNIVVKALGQGEPRITMDLTNVSVLDALRHIAQLCGLSVQIEPHALALLPAPASSSVALKTPPSSSIPGLERIPGFDFYGAPIAKKAPSSGPDGEKPAPIQIPSATQAPFFDSSIPIDISADKTRFENGVAVAEDNVSFKYKEITITAHRLDYDPTTKLVHAQGTLILSDPANTIEAKDLTLDLMTRKIKAFGPHKITIRDFGAPAASGGTK